jgi:hypothetical protein
MNPYREWFCEYEWYDGIIGQRKFKLRLIYGRIRILLGVLHIPGLAINFISVRKIDDVWVKTIFEKETCRMVQGATVLLKGVWFGNMYMLHGSTSSDGCNSSIVPDIGVEEERTPTFSG